MLAKKRLILKKPRLVLTKKKDTGIPFHGYNPTKIANKKDTKKYV